MDPENLPGSPPFSIVFFYLFTLVVCGNCKVCLGFVCFVIQNVPAAFSCRISAIVSSFGQLCRVVVGFTFWLNETFRLLLAASLEIVNALVRHGGVAWFNPEVSGTERFISSVTLFLRDIDDYSALSPCHPRHPDRLTAYTDS